MNNVNRLPWTYLAAVSSSFFGATGTWRAARALRSTSSKRAAARLGALAQETGAEQSQHQDPGAESERHPPHCVRRVDERGPPVARVDPTIVPAIATPRVVPVCRPVEASEVATPAIDRGMPDR